MMRRSVGAVARLSFVLSLAPAGHALQRVWTVSVGGNADFQELQRAVDAAASGDTILVWGPANGHFELAAVTIEKGLTVVGVAPERVRLDDLVVRNVPEGEPVVLVNLSVGERDPHPSAGVADLAREDGARIEDCAAPIVLQSCTFRGGWFDPGGAGLRARNARVALLHCELEGGRGGDVGTSRTGVPNQQHGLVLEEARAFLAGCLALGSHGDWLEAYEHEVGGRGGDGVRASGASALWLLDSSALGGTGWRVTGWPWMKTYGGDGGDGAHLEPTAFGYARASHVHGGPGAEGDTGDGEDGDDVVGDVAVQGGAELALELPHWVRDGDAVTATVRGTPGMLAFVGIGEEPGWRELGAAGVLAVRGAAWIPLGRIPASGELRAPLPLDAVDAHGSRRVLVQAAYRDNTSAALGEARALVVLDEAWLPEGTRRLHVDPTAPHGGDGASWATAFRDLRDALEEARGVGPGTTDVWIRKGLYRPFPKGTDPLEPFFVKSRTRLFGGFAGHETELAQRDPAVHATVLSGDLLLDDTQTDARRDDNSRLVLAVGPWERREAVVIDGLTVRAGHLEGLNGYAPAAFRGSGLELNGQVDVAGCTFLDNRLGSALFAMDGSDVRVVNCRFLGNRGGFFGVYGGKGGACQIGWSTSEGSASFAGCELAGNTSAWGGALCALVPTRVVGCTFYGNAADYRGGAVFATDDLDVQSTVFWANVGEEADPDIGLGFSTPDPRVDWSLFAGASTSTWGTGNVEGPPHLADPDGADDRLGTRDDDMTPLAVSPAVDAGNNAALPADALDVDADGDTSEPLPRDWSGAQRRSDDPNVPDTGSGTPPLVDMGSRERQGAAPR